MALLLPFPSLMLTLLIWKTILGYINARKSASSPWSLSSLEQKKRKEHSRKLKLFTHHFSQSQIFVSLKSKILYTENQIKMIPNEELKTKEFDQRGKYFASSVRQIKWTASRKKATKNGVVKMKDDPVNKFLLTRNLFPKLQTILKLTVKWYCRQRSGQSCINEKR